MRIVQSVQYDGQFMARVRESIAATHQRLIGADLETPAIKEYLDGVRVVLSERMVSRAGIAKPLRQTIVLNARLLSIYPNQLLAVIVHEVAHLLAYKFHGD